MLSHADGTVVALSAGGGLIFGHGVGRQAGVIGFGWLAGAVACQAAHPA